MVLTIIAAVVTIFILNWRLALLSLITVPLLGLAGQIFGPRAAGAGMQRQRRLAHAVRTLQENLASQSVVKAFGLEDWSNRRFAQCEDEVYQASVQESILFDLSIRENIRLGNLSAPDEEVEQAAREAEIHETILAMPRGYDTPVGEYGGELSGGQRQRIAIARAIVRNPSNLLLDEATSALDAETESAVVSTLARVGSGRTVVNVTHRLASAADRIVVLDRGKVVEQGVHADLVNGDGLYAIMWREQMGITDGHVAQRQAASTSAPTVR